MEGKRVRDSRTVMAQVIIPHRMRILQETFMAGLS